MEPHAEPTAMIVNGVEVTDADQPIEWWDAMRFTTFHHKEIDGQRQCVGVTVSIRAKPQQSNGAFSADIDLLKLIIRRYERRHSGVEVSFEDDFEAGDSDNYVACRLRVNWPPRAPIAKAAAKPAGGTQARGTSNRSKQPKAA